MARSFDGVDDKIDCGSAAILDNLDPLTICAWIYPISAGEGNAGRIVDKGGNTRTHTEDSNRFSIFRNRATTGTYYRAATNTIVLSAWQFVACLWRSASAPNGKLYHGTPTVLAAEPSYDTSTDGSGAATTDAADSLVLGNNAAGSATFNGREAYAMLFNAFLTIDEVRSIQFGIIPAHLYADLKGFWPLWGVASPEPDLSGNGNNGTVTGAVAANGPPLGKPWSRRRFYSLQYTATPLLDAQPAVVLSFQGLTDTQPAYVPGLLAITGTLPAAALTLEVVTDAQPAWAGVQSVFTGSQPAYVPGKVDVSGAVPGFALTLEVITDNQPAYIPGLLAMSNAQPAIVIGKLDVTDSQPAFAITLAVLTNAQAAIGMSMRALSGALPAAALTLEVVTDSQPAVALGKQALTAANPAFAYGSLVLLDSQPAVVMAFGALSGSQAAFVRSYPNLSVSALANPSTYEPVQLLELTL